MIYAPSLAVTVQACTTAEVLRIDITGTPALLAQIGILYTGEGLTVTLGN